MVTSIVVDVESTDQVGEVSAAGKRLTEEGPETLTEDGNTTCSHRRSSSNTGRWRPARSLLFGLGAGLAYAGPVIGCW
jgi:hypothetical protein